MLTRIKILIVAVLHLLAVSCATNEEVVKRGVTTEPAAFPKIKNCNAILECISPKRTFYSSSPAVFIFKLTNLSCARLVVYEWMMNESDNIRLYCVPWEEGTDIPPKEQWTCVAPEIKKPVRRMTLDLGTKNSAIINKELDFLKEVLKAPIEKPRLFLVCAELNLESLKLKTNTMKIVVRP